MYSHFRLAKKYLHYYITASNGKGHGIHSPFVYDFVRNVLNDKRNFYAYRQAEALRYWLLRDNTIVETEDVKAAGKTKQLTIASITRHTAKSPKWGQLLFRIVNYYQPLTILELDAAPGIATAYMALANPHARVITCAGNPQIAGGIKKHLLTLDLQQLTVMESGVDDSLPGILRELQSVDLVFIDSKSVLENFDRLMAKTHNDSILVVDNIHRGPDWAAIRQHPAVKLTIDLFFMGLVFFKEEFKVPQHFTIRF